MTTIHGILDDLARAATDARDKGDKFERLMAAYLRTEPLYQDQFSDVWLWSDWPGREGRPDTGIDIVAQERTGGVCAIQCKFYDPSHTCGGTTLIPSWRPPVASPSPAACW